MDPVQVLLVLLVSNIYRIDAARILAVYPTPSISHQVVFRPLTNELLKLGHEVVVLTTDPEYPKGQAPKNLTEIDVHDVSYKIWREQIVDALVDGDSSRNLEVIADFVDIMTEMAEEQFQVDEIKDIIRNQNDTFDLLIVEAWTRITLGFSHVIKAPVIQFASFGPLFDQMEIIGAPVHPVLYPQTPHVRVHNLSTWERLKTHYDNFWFLRRVFAAERRVDNFNKRIFGLDTPPLNELKNNVDMLFLNINPIFEGNRPVPPGVIYVPGLHQKAPKDLPTDLKKYLDSSVHGVIYVSFGTNVNPSLLPPEKVQNMIRALSELPYDVLWKWNDSEFPGRTDNIRISKWLPQSDLLRHPKIKVFITQGGLQSTDESITGGVPLIGIPMYGDQYYNVDKYVHFKIGKRINLPELEVDSFRDTIETVIEDKSYRENIIRLRSQMHDQPMSSLERAVWWTEHALRHGGARHLRAPAANMSLVEYYELDLVLTVLGVAMIVSVLSVFLVKKFARLIVRQFGFSVKVKRA